MESLPSYYVRSEQIVLLAGQKSSRGRQPSVPFIYRPIVLAVGIAVALSLMALVILMNEPFVPTLPAFWSQLCISLVTLFKGRGSGHDLTPGFEASWEGLKGGEHCLRYATRQYTARLSDSSPGQDAMRACKETPVEIHGQLLYADFCQNLGFNRGVWGYWIVDFDEPECETRWGEFTDVGCLNRPVPTRRVEAQLQNLRKWDDWQFMCVTTPADIDGKYYLTPKECFNEGRWGIYGAWDLRDDSCADSAQSNGTTMGRIV